MVQMLSGLSGTKFFLFWGIRTVFMIFDLIFEFIVDNYEK